MFLKVTGRRGDEDERTEVGEWGVRRGERYMVRELEGLQFSTIFGFLKDTSI